MTKLDTILFAERLRDAIRKLPDDADIYGWELTYDTTTQKKVIRIHLNAPVKWAAVFDGMEFPEWRQKVISITPFATAWWAERKK